MQFLVKTIISAIIITLIAELSKRDQLLGGLLASLPIVSILAMCWLYLDTKNPVKVSALSTSIFWMVLPSLVFFISLPYLLKHQMPFYLAMILSCLVTAFIYYLAFTLYQRLGISAGLF